MIDPGFVMTTCYTIVSRNGAAGQPLHGGWFYGAGHTYHFRDDSHALSRSISLAASRRRDGNGDGGLMLVPGSHKARLPLPRPKQTSCGKPQVKHMQSPNGDLYRHDNAWRAKLAQPHRERRFVNTKAGPNIRRRSAKHKVSDLDGRPKNESGWPSMRQFSIEIKNTGTLWMGWFSVESLCS